ncbi:MAG: hypothetical protein ICV63_01700 [Coleofasciculus sp. Co-bin14]|nr:hypothetical protein [Coleofasciculus sp. Co-bin14]
MKERIQQFLTDIERVRENLLALSDDIWLNIQHNNSQELQKGYEFKLAFNDKLDAFNQISSQVSELVQQFTDVHVESVTIAQQGSPEHERIIQELDLTKLHTLAENFTYKRPLGFIFQGKAYKGVNTWRNLYELFCRQLAEEDFNRFKNFIESSHAITVRGGAIFTHEPTQLRTALEIANGIYAEGNLSANAIRDRIKFLLNAFEIDLQEVSIYLREERSEAESLV